MKLLHCYLPLWTLLLIPFAVLLSSYSDGPPAGRTGAPGELTCFNGYCHNSYQLNSGPGAVSLEGTEQSQFVPGQPFRLSLKVVQDTMNAYGFSISARTLNENLAAGSWEKDEFTQIKAEDAFTYLMHDTAQVASDEGSWILTWLPPDSLTADVEFFVAAVASNHDGKRSGDYVYTFRKIFFVDPLASVSNPDNSRLTWYIKQHQLVIQVPDPSRRAEVDVMDLHGRIMAHVQDRASVIQIDVGPWPRQAYFVRLRQGEKMLGGKILLR